jgi:sugar phosphate isomerase/epimerase
MPEMAVRQRSVYLATVCLERNRWGSREPSFCVSDWLPRFAADGFDGIELWENHYLKVDARERDALHEARSAIAIFNTYTGFSNDAADVEHRRTASSAIAGLGVRAVKYNVGGDSSRVEEYKKNLCAWADSLSPACRLLCECHPGTVLEKPDSAAAFFAELDPSRFGVIAHVNGDAPALDDWLHKCGPRLQHIHVQLREPDQATPKGLARLRACVNVLQSYRYAGTASIEFTRGIGNHEQIAAIYAEAVADLAAYREAWN